MIDSNNYLSLEKTFEHNKLTRIHTCPVVIEKASGDVAVWVEAPVRETNSCLLNVVDEIVLPDALFRGRVTEKPTELAKPNRCCFVFTNKSPMVVPDIDEIVWKIIIIKPGLVFNSRTKVVGTIDKFEWNLELYWKL
jgi:hypothetical protein